MDFDSRPLIAITGPTASSKTRRAVEIAREFDGEIISADSRQVYTGMDLGTGKDLEEYGSVRHHLIDICPAGDKYNLYRYLKDYNSSVDSILSRGKTPVVCGGSGMYLEAALEGTVLPEVPPDESLRSRLEGLSLEELTAILAGMKRLHNVTDVDNVKRAVRAIEIEEYYRAHPEERPEERFMRRNLNTIIIGIEVPREVRRQRITERLKKRLERGMVDEVRSLIESGVDTETLEYYGLEYKWIARYLKGSLTYDEMCRNLEIAIHQFAKRQMTWFRGMERRGHSIHWIPYDVPTDEFIGRVRNLIDS